MLPLLLLPIRASAADLSLEAMGRYRGYWGDIDGFAMQEQLFQEQLRAELDTILVRRAIGALNVGFALDHTQTIGPDSTSRLLALQYHADLDLDPGGTFPIRLFASRQITGTSQSLFPGYRVQSDTFGYRAAIRPEGLPRLESSAIVQHRVTENQDVLRDERLSIINGTLAHNDNRLMAFATVEVRRDADPSVDRRRDINEADAYLEYRLDRATSVVGRGRTRRFVSVVDGVPTTVDVNNSEATFLTRPSKKLTGLVYYRVAEQTTDQLRTGDATVGTTWTWYPTREISGAAQVGVGDSWTGDRQTLSSTFGEFANVSANHTRWGKNGGWQIFGQTGVASLGTPTANGAALERPVAFEGVQGGGAAGAIVRRALGPVVLGGGGNVGRQWDTSPRAQSYVAWGWLAEVSTRSWQLFQLQFQATEAVIDQRALDVGDSDRLLARGLVTLRPDVRFDVSYGLNAFRNVLDDEESSGLGHSFGLRAVPLERVQIIGVYQHNEADTGSRIETDRAELQARFRLPICDASARLQRLRTEVGANVTTETIAWVELSRAFDWRLR